MFYFVVPIVSKNIWLMEVVKIVQDIFAANIR